MEKLILNYSSAAEKPLPTADDRGTLKAVAVWHFCVGTLLAASGTILACVNLDRPELIAGSLFAAYGIAAIFSGYSMVKHRRRRFSMIFASVTALGFPAGTIFGGYTLYILSFPGIRQLYLEAAN